MLIFNSMQEEIEKLKAENKLVASYIAHLYATQCDATTYIHTSLPDVTCGQFRDHWLKRLGCELQRGVAFSVCHNAEGWHRSNQHVEELKFAILDFV